MVTLPAHPMQLPSRLRIAIEQAYPGFLEWYAKLFTGLRRVYGHWSVTGYCSPDKAYHREIILDSHGKAVVINPSNVPLTQDLNGHTDGRNNLNQCNIGSIAVCIGALDVTATTRNLGDKPPTKAEVDAFILETVLICNELKLPASVLMTHAEAANNVDFPSVDAPGIPAPPSYGPGMSDFERWDLHVRYNPTTGQMVPLFDGATALYPAGSVPRGPINARAVTLAPGWWYFPDYWRYSVLKGIAELNKAHWSKS